MNDAIRDALDHGQLVDMTTTGAKSGRPRRIEIVLHSFDRHLYVSGIPNPVRKRAWLANLEADPRFTIHLRGPVATDIPAQARLITDPVERRAVLAKVAQVWHRTDIEVMVGHSPLIEATVEGYPG